MAEELTEEELALSEDPFEEVYGGYPVQEEKQNIFNFFKNVIKQPDNTKTANLTNDELGIVQLPVRTNLGIAGYCKFMGMKGFAKYFEEEAQILLKTSLSREGFLDKLAVTQKRESEIKSKRMYPSKKGFFGKKKKPEEEYKLY